MSFPYTQEDIRQYAALKIRRKREQIWIQAWCAVANTFNSTQENARNWADNCLVEFDKRFPQ